MQLSAFFKSIIEQDKCSIVVCNLQHQIIYMNQSAIQHYSKHSGSNLVGTSIFDCHNAQSNEKINQVVSWFSKSKNNNIVYTFHNEKQNKDVYMIALRDDNSSLIGYYEKHEYRNAETMKMYDFE